MAAKKASSEVVDLRASIVALRPAVVGADGYSEVDRYRDLHAVLTRGESTIEQRERVLFQLLDACWLNRPLDELAGAPGGDEKIWIAAGRQRVGLLLLDWLTKEPENG